MTGEHTKIGAQNVHVKPKIFLVPHNTKMQARRKLGNRFLKD